MAQLVRKVDHIGIAVRNLDDAIQRYTALFGRGPQNVEDVAEQGVRVAFFQAGESHFELLEPTSPDSPVARFLDKRGEGIHHVCVEVADLEDLLQRYDAAGIECIDRQPRLGARGKRIAFVHPRSTAGVLLELSETPVVCAQRPRAPHGNPPHEEGDTPAKGDDDAR